MRSPKCLFLIVELTSEENIMGQGLKMSSGLLHDQNKPIWILLDCPA